MPYHVKLLFAVIDRIGEMEMEIEYLQETASSKEIAISKIEHYITATWGASGENGHYGFRVLSTQESN